MMNRAISCQVESPARHLYIPIQKGDETNHSVNRFISAGIAPKSPEAEAPRGYPGLTHITLLNQAVPGGSVTAGFVDVAPGALWALSPQAPMARWHHLRFGCPSRSWPVRNPRSKRGRHGGLPSSRRILCK